MAMSTRLRRGASGEDGTRLLERVREVTRAYPNDRFAQLTLARAEATLGDVTQARALLEPYITAHPDDVEALYLTGLTYIREARDAKTEERVAERDERYSQARRYFVRAHRLDENHVPTLYRYAETFSGATQSASSAENTLNVLLLARQLAPQVQEIGINAAQALLAHGRAAEAVPILRVVAYDPHGGGTAEAAREMLAEAEAAATAPTAP
jgi:tetratricopeptide (TPR) repeat protein